MNSTIDIARNLSMRHNVAFNVYDRMTGQLIQHHEGHNSATNSLLTGIGHYLIGDGVLNQGYAMLDQWVPKYISLGTMGLANQDSDEHGLPAGISNYVEYMRQIPGFGADGYDQHENNNRTSFGLGTVFSSSTESSQIVDTPAEQTYVSVNNQTQFTTSHRIAEILSVKVNSAEVIASVSYDIGNRYFLLSYAPQVGSTIIVRYMYFEDSSAHTVDCELISDTFPRAPISYRKVVRETQSEKPRTIDVVFSAMISTGALKQFRAPGNDYIFITEAGLWSRKTWPTNSSGQIDYTSGDNGLLAGYRIAPASLARNFGESDADWENRINSNHAAIQQEILRVGYNQVVQIVWKIQLGSIQEFGLDFS